MVETLGEELAFVKKQLKKALMASSRDISNRKIQQEVEQLRLERDELVGKISQYGKNHIEGANTAPTTANRKARIVVGY